MADQLENSILRTIKKMLGLDLDYEAFNTDVITHINTALMTLQQLGVGPENGMFITGLSESWSDFFPSDAMLEAAKSYIYYQCRMVFDPPQSAHAMDSLQKQSDMLEWRLREQARFYEAKHGKYVWRHPDPIPDTVETSVSDENGKQTKISGEVTFVGTIGNTYSSSECDMECGRCAYHIERDGITPLDDIGQNVCMKGGCCP